MSPDEEGDDYEEVRRSRRAKTKPIKFWLGEKLEYAEYQPGRHNQVPVIAGIRRIPEIDLPRKRRTQQKSRSKSRKLHSEEPEQLILAGNPEDGWDDETDPMGVVVDYDTREEISRRELNFYFDSVFSFAVMLTWSLGIAFTSAMVVPKGTQKGQFSFQKIFSDKQFVAAGQLVIPVGGNKPKKII